MQREREGGERGGEGNAQFKFFIFKTCKQTFVLISNAYFSFLKTNVEHATSPICKIVCDSSLIFFYQKHIFNFPNVYLLGLI